VDRLRQGEAAAAGVVETCRREQPRHGRSLVEQVDQRGREAEPTKPAWNQHRVWRRTWLIRITQTMARGEPMRKLFAGSMQQRSGIISGAVC
jgi:hypothetical protein